MNKINLIIAREYLTRVKKKSFLVMTILGPLLIAGLVIVPALLRNTDKDVQTIEVVDETGMFINQLKNTGNITFTYQFQSIGEAQKQLEEDKSITSVLYLAKEAIGAPRRKGKAIEVQLFHEKQPGISTVRYIENQISSTIQGLALQEKYALNVEDLNDLKPRVDLITSTLDSDGKADTTITEVQTVVAFMCAMFIYFFIFLFGVQVMRGVIEEKTSRIVEVIISSVRPFQLMLGKIVGIALVGITQFALWVILSVGILSAAQFAFQDELAVAQQEQLKMEQFNPEAGEQADEQSAAVAAAFEKIGRINFPLVLSCFLFYFLGGYLLYGALFAAIGSAVDNETDTQQFMLPITMPLILALVLGQAVIDNPDGNLAFWASMIPFTSPIVMMVRIPFGVETWEIAVSMISLVATFIFTTWIAARIYRTGILMYGKKVNFKEIGKWLFYKG